MVIVVLNKVFDGLSNVNVLIGVIVYVIVIDIFILGFKVVIVLIIDFLGN